MVEMTRSAKTPVKKSSLQLVETVHSAKKPRTPSSIRAANRPNPIEKTLNMTPSKAASKTASKAASKKPSKTGSRDDSSGTDNRSGSRSRKKTYDIITSSHDKIGHVKATLRSRHMPDVTHLISHCNAERHCPRTVKYLRGLLDGLLIVSYDWYLASLSADKFVDETPFLITGDEVAGATYAVEKSISSTGARLFEGLSFHLEGTFRAPAPKKSDLALLITAGGGKVTRNPEKLDTAHWIVHDEPIDLEDGTNSIDWASLLECISYYKPIQANTN
ncbi:hypothetical protein PSACC_01716 [Paramicrosporidium saccamoebae]|uniref:BRCT domain-containing protein n=1 Tax=Paramicrosporidium saccamoebae TaxID=1246581 RepID=A0A2H9TL36_9FUNG|nr:hypothetical protein PSACC_01716 [Paramicrosporidium saccamoebae]